jgi:hypothetical protein
MAEHLVLMLVSLWAELLVVMMAAMKVGTRVAKTVDQKEWK